MATEMLNGTQNCNRDDIRRIVDDLYGVYIRSYKYHLKDLGRSDSTVRSKGSAITNCLVRIVNNYGSVRLTHIDASHLRYLDENLMLTPSNKSGYLSVFGEFVAFFSGHNPMIDYRKEKSLAKFHDIQSQ